MKILMGMFAAVQALMAALFAAASIALIVVAARTGWNAVAGGMTTAAGQTLIESIGLLAAAVVALQIAQTIAEEEVFRSVLVSAPTRVRRFLSRFLVVMMVALVFEGLVATFKAVHEDLRGLLYAASLLAATGLLLAAWGIFIRSNRAAEELEPEAMREAKREDDKLQQKNGGEPG